MASRRKKNPKNPRKKKKQRRECLDEAEGSRLEALPPEILIKILCGIDHKDFKQVFHVSKAIREATVIARADKPPRRLTKYSYAVVDREREALLAEISRQLPERKRRREVPDVNAIKNKNKNEKMNEEEVAEEVDEEEVQQKRKAAWNFLRDQQLHERNELIEAAAAASAAGLLVFSPKDPRNYGYCLRCVDDQVCKGCGNKNGWPDVAIVVDLKKCRFCGCDHTHTNGACFYAKVHPKFRTGRLFETLSKEAK